MSRDGPIVGFISLGCAKNLVDTEVMLGKLAEAGCLIAADETQAEVIVVNTCGFIAAARSEAHEAIRRAVACKKHGVCRRIVVAGCLVQRDGARLAEQFDQIDVLLAPAERDEIVRAVKGRSPRRRGRPQRAPGTWQDSGRLRITPRHYAYLRISEGCNQKCSFCTIPAIRGPMRSKRPQAVLAEARELIADGAVELNLIGQDTSSYGRDIGYEPGLAGLLRQLDRLEGVRWIRLLYTYPSTLTDEAIDAIAECERVVKYVDVPLQHINDRILRAMRRGMRRAGTERLLARLRERIPNVSLRTTLIVGFPGETDQEFEELLAFVRAFRFDALGVFAFSPEPDTPAGRRKDQVPEPVKAERLERLMLAQQEIAFKAAAAQIGRPLEVLIDGAAADGELVGRHAGQAPEVDAVTFLPAGAGRCGQIVRATCVGSRGYDLLARPSGGILPTASAMPAPSCS